jgi:uncharacterized paraquat-inducible protein A
MHSTIRVRCPGCNARIKAPFELLGQTRGCPRCKRRLVIKTKTPDDAEPLLSSDEMPVASQLTRAS